MSDNVVPFPADEAIDLPEIIDGYLVLKKDDDVYLEIAMSGPVACYFISLFACYLQNEKNNER